jgi:hypothetical protein
LAPVMTTLELEPMSKPSVFLPPAVSPAVLSIVMLVTVKPSQPLMLTAWRGVFWMCRLVMVESVRPWA